MACRWPFRTNSATTMQLSPKTSPICQQLPASIGASRAPAHGRSAMPAESTAWTPSAAAWRNSGVMPTAATARSRASPGRDGRPWRVPNQRQRAQVLDLVVVGHPQRVAHDRGRDRLGVQRIGLADRAGELVHDARVDLLQARLATAFLRLVLLLRTATADWTHAPMVPVRDVAQPRDTPSVRAATSCRLMSRIDSPFEKSVGGGPCRWPTTRWPTTLGKLCQVGLKDL